MAGNGPAMRDFYEEVLGDLLRSGRLRSVKDGGTRFITAEALRA